MIPLYFPFTYISAPVLSAFSACFQPVALYQPAPLRLSSLMQQWIQEGVLEVRTPIKNDARQIQAVLKDFQRWSDLHGRGRVSYYTGQKEAAPFFNEYDVSRIRTDVVAAGKNQDRPGKPDISYRARLFLLIAQELDLQNDEIAAHLWSADRVEEGLFQDLLGEEEQGRQQPVHGKRMLPREAENHLIPQRLAAWRYLLEKDDPMPGVLITSSRGVMAQLLEMVPGAQKLQIFDSIPMDKPRSRAMEAWSKQLTRWLDALVKTPWPCRSTDNISRPPVESAGGGTVSLTLYIVPGQTPEKVLGRCAVRPFMTAPEIRPDPGLENTVVGLMEKN